MADQIGLTPPKMTLVLCTGADLQWAFQWDGGDYPAGSALYFLIGEDQWDFDITGDLASIKIEAEVADLVAARTPWRLIFQEDTTPTTETLIAYGVVKRVP